MTRKELRQRVRELDVLLCETEMSEEWNEHYEEYCELRAIEQRIYFEENEPKLIEYFYENIKDKPICDIESSDWDFYSDWHKDVYGFRPRTTSDCGEYRR